MSCPQRHPQKKLPAEAPAPAVEEDVVVAEIIASAADKEVVLVDESGDPLEMASQDSAELLSEVSDPWYTVGGVTYGFSSTGSCVPGVLDANCTKNLSNPIQAAIDAAPIGSTIFIKPDASYSLLEVNVNKVITLSGVRGNTTTDTAIGSYVTIKTLNLFVDIPDWSYILSNTVNVKNDTAKINDAVKIVKTGGTVNVSPGTYQEHVVVNKDDITLNGNLGAVTVAGAALTAPILEGNDDTGIGFDVSGDNVSINGFVIRNFETGIQLNVSGANSFEATNNTIISNVYGTLNFNSIPSLQLHYNDFQGNTIALFNAATGGGAQYVHAENNYWGCDCGPVVKYCTDWVTNDGPDHCEGEWLYYSWQESEDAQSMVLIGNYTALQNSEYAACGVLYGTNDKYDHQKNSANPFAPFKIILGPTETEHEEPVCGDGVVNQDSEQCDDGNKVNGDHCSSTCQTELWCGDGIINGSDICDGSALPADLPAGVTCSGTCTLNPYCGDNTIDDGEECDGTALPTDVPSDTTCSATCDLGSYCGDDTIDDGEECDGTALPTDVPSDTTCSATCDLGSYCGDDTIDDGEECDGTALPTDVPSDTTCSATCDLGSYCGDDTIDDGEECDGTALPTDVPSDTTCSATCDLGSYCGDNTIDDGEECDGTALPTDVPSDTTCSATCDLGSYCGDNTIDDGEECDGTALPTDVPSDTTCSATCDLGSYCGDDTIDDGEECDGTALPTDVPSDTTCSATCDLGSYCGDDTIDDGEECDGTALPTDVPSDTTCSATCDLGSYCGDNTIDDGEECDGTALPTDVPSDTTCSATCDLGSYCGDDTIDDGEECDGTALPTDVPSDTTCSATCDLGSYCGDDTIDDGEECDGTALPTGLPAGVTCGGTCTLDPYCGNGEEEGREECDLGAQNGVANSGCSSLCEELPVCGDEVAEGEETCDDGNLDRR